MAGDGRARTVGRNLRRSPNRRVSGPSGSRHGRTKEGDHVSDRLLTHCQRRRGRRARGGPDRVSLGPGRGHRRRIAMTPFRLAVAALALAGLFSAGAAMGGQTHPFQTEFTGSDTPDGSLGNTADRVAIRQTTGAVYVIDKSHGVVDTF